MSLILIVDVMAKCGGCGREVGCDCNLLNGLCEKCFGSVGTITMQKINNKTKPIISNYCNATIEELQTLFSEYKNKKNKTNLDMYYSAIILSQIKAFDKNPCQYYQIISKL